MRLLKSVSQLGKQRHKIFLGKKGYLAVVLQYLRRSGLCPVSSSFPMLNKIKQHQGTFQDNKYQDTYNSCFIYQICDPNILHFGKKNILKPNYLSEMGLKEYKLRLSFCIFFKICSASKETRSGPLSADPSTQLWDEEGNAATRRTLQLKPFLPELGKLLVCKEEWSIMLEERTMNCLLVQVSPVCVNHTNIIGPFHF